MMANWLFAETSGFPLVVGSPTENPIANYIMVKGKFEYRRKKL